MNLICLLIFAFYERSCQNNRYLLRVRQFLCGVVLVHFHESATNIHYADWNFFSSIVNCSLKIFENAKYGSKRETEILWPRDKGMSRLKKTV